MRPADDNDSKLAEPECPFRGKTATTSLPPATRHAGGHSDALGFDQNFLRLELPQVRKNTGTLSLRYHENRVSRAKEAETILTMRCWMRMVSCDATQNLFGLRLLDKATVHAYCHNDPRVDQARSLVKPLQ